MVELETDVLLAPGVLIMDHNHEFHDVNSPIHTQGVTSGGSIKIERNCWLGYNAVVIAAGKEVVIGRNSVVAANSVVTRSVSPFSVVAGAPAREVRRFDPALGDWILSKECGERNA
jgi:acetyltransferase-like isoleucine patch superfamily enzyme